MLLLKASLLIALAQPPAIDYAQPARYLQPGTQSALDAETMVRLRGEIGASRADVAAIGRVVAWVRRQLPAYAGGGALIGRTTAKAILAAGQRSGCHDTALLVATILRGLGMPAILVDTAGVRWAEEARGGRRGMVGHVFLELFAEGHWILVDPTTGEYLERYDPACPVIPLRTGGQEKGYYVLYKGVDPAGYGVTGMDVLGERMRAFAAALDRTDLACGAQYDGRGTRRF